MTKRKAGRPRTKRPKARINFNRYLINNRLIKELR